MKIYERQKVEYKIAKRQLKILIRQTKKEHWRDFCKELEQDVWRQGYKTVTKSLVGGPPVNPTTEMKVECIKALFPQHEERVVIVEASADWVEMTKEVMRWSWKG